jgi:hypothetical protein
VWREGVLEWEVEVVWVTYSQLGCGVERKEGEGDARL